MDLAGESRCQRMLREGKEADVNKTLLNEALNKSIIFLEENAVVPSLLFDEQGLLTQLDSLDDTSAALEGDQELFPSSSTAENANSITIYKPVPSSSVVLEGDQELFPSPAMIENDTTNHKPVTLYCSGYNNYLLTCEARNSRVNIPSRLVEYSSSSSDDISQTDEPEAVDISITENSVNESTEASSDSSLETGRRRKKKLTKKQLNKKRRSSGLKYKDYKGRKLPAKVLLPNPCEEKQCQNCCNSFSHEERKALFDMFWKIGDATKQKSFINGCINVISVKRKRVGDESRRNLTYEHFFVRANKSQAKVCQQFFLATLGITQRVIRNAIKGKLDEMKDLRGQHAPKHKLTDKQKTELQNFIKRLPAVPSHYCRGSSSKLYLSADVKSYINLFKMYKSSIGESQAGMSYSSFRRIIKTEYNIGIHVPKKDKCAKCEKYKHLPSALKTEKETNEYLLHIKEKDEAKFYFLEKQKEIPDKSVVASFDLQKVLTTPHGPSMLLGFSRKYAYYNFTIYESNTANGYCYVWGEKDGKRGAIEICSHIYLYLTKLDDTKDIESVHLFCDNCPGQNKNKYIMSMIMYFLRASSSINKIVLTYLVAGHTYMPVDSMHANIERKIKNLQVQAPSEWSTIIRNARTKPKPYEVTAVDHSQFLNWKSILSMKKLKNTEGNEIKIADIKTIEFEKGNSNVKIKTSYNKDSPISEVPFTYKDLQMINKAYTSELPISKKKYEDLINLCRNYTIAPQYHAEYYSLKCGNIPDTLPETDIEDDF